MDQDVVVSRRACWIVLESFPTMVCADVKAHKAYRAAGARLIGSSV
jgi:hypothetical protein